MPVRRRLYLVIPLFCLLPLWFVHAAASQPATTHAPAPTATPSVNPFGAVEAYYRPAEATELGLSWERIIFEWRYFQPDSAADWDTSHVPDEELHSAADANREVVGLIKNAPHWATGSGLWGAVPLGVDKPIDDPDNLFAAFVTRLVTYYSTHWHIHHWIIYNEPDIRPSDTDRFEFVGSESDYYQVLKTAYLAAHAADPQAVIHLAGTTWWQDVVHKRPLWLERFLRVALKDPEARKHGLFFDVLSIHVYDQTELVWKMTTQLTSLPAVMGFPKPVWIDELNAQPTVDGAWQLDNPQHPISLDQQVAFIVQASALSLALGVQRVGIYRLYDDVDPDQAGINSGMGLVRYDGSYRPAYYAYQAVIREFSGTIKANRYGAAGVTAVVLVQADRTVSVLWNQTDKPINAQTPHQDALRLLSPLGGLIFTTLNGHSDEFTLPPCLADCLIEGAPRILITSSSKPPALYALDSKGDTSRIN